MKALAQNEELRALLRRLIAPVPLLLYTLKIKQGYRSQLTARLFAARWLRGNVDGAMRLVRGREEKA